MKVSSIKTFVPAMAMGVASLVSCTNPHDAALRYMEDKPYAEFLEVSSTGNLAHTQSKLDSVAYKDLFLTTQAGKDSSNIAEYNKIAAKMRGYNPKETDYSIVSDSLITHASKAGVPTKVVYGLEDVDFLKAWDAQYHFDKWAYGNYFSKLGLMKDMNFVKQFEDVAQKIKPSMF